VEGFEWVAELKDGMSRPAQVARGGLASLRSEILATDKALLQLNRDMHEASKPKPIAPAGSLAAMRAQRFELQQQRKEAALAAREMGPGSRSMASQITTSLTVYGLLSSSIRRIGENAKWAATQVYELVTGGIKLALEMNELKTRSMRMFEGLGGPGAGEAIYKMVQDLRREIPQSEREIASWSSTLMAAGMTDPGKLKATIKAMASASALMGGGEMGAAAADKIKTLIARALETGSFKVRGGARALVGTGVTSTELATALGMSPRQMDQAMSKGLIAADRGIAALQKILTEKGARAVAGEMATLPVIINKAQEAFAHLFDGVDVRGFLGELMSLGSILDSNSINGMIWHAQIKQAFDGAVQLATKMVRGVKLGLIELEIAYLKFEIRNAALVRAWMKLHVAGLLVSGVLLAIQAALTQVLTLVQIVVAPFTALAWAVEKLVNAIGVGSERGMGATGIRPTLAGPPESVPRAPGHAKGGMVMRPSEGEYFASVAPGEVIVPGDEARSLNAPQLGASGQGGGDTITPVNVGGIHIHEPKDPQDTIDLLESQLADVFERAALEGGRA
jgi:hypothetical protein